VSRRADPFAVWAEQVQRDWVDEDGRPLAEVASPHYPPDTVEVAFLMAEPQTHAEAEAAFWSAARGLPAAPGA
jgi:hypothetical protein